jgi:hypothetical protein
VGINRRPIAEAATASEAGAAAAGVALNPVTRLTGPGAKAYTAPIAVAIVLITATPSSSLL